MSCSDTETEGGSDWLRQGLSGAAAESTMPASALTSCVAYGAEAGTQHVSETVLSHNHSVPTKPLLDPSATPAHFYMSYRTRDVDLTHKNTLIELKSLIFSPSLSFSPVFKAVTFTACMYV